MKKKAEREKGIVQLQPMDGGKDPGPGGGELKERRMEEGPYGGRVEVGPCNQVEAFKWPKCASSKLKCGAVSALLAGNWCVACRRL